MAFLYFYCTIGITMQLLRNLSHFPNKSYRFELGIYGEAHKYSYVKLIPTIIHVFRITCVVVTAISIHYAS